MLHLKSKWRCFFKKYRGVFFQRGKTMRKFLYRLTICLCLWVPTAYAETGYLFSVNIFGFGSRSVSLIDPVTNTILNATLSSFDEGASPRNIAANPTGTIVYITVRGDQNVVYVIEAQDLIILQTISVGNAPEAIVASPDGTKLYVADQTDKTISVIDVESGYQITEIIPLETTGFGPSGMAISPDSSTLYVCNSEDNIISVIDTESNTVTHSIAMQSGDWPLFIILNADGTTAYVANQDAGTVSVIDTATLEITATIPVGNDSSSQPTSIALNPDTHTAYTTNQADNTISVIDTDLNILTSNIEAGNAPTSIVTKFDNTIAYVAIKNDGVISVLDLNSNTFTDTIEMESFPLNLALFYEVTADISPTTVDFSNEYLGATSAAQTVTLTNTDGPPVTISDITTTGDFSQTNTCTSSITSGNTCTISIVFTPTELNTRTGTLTIIDNTSESPHTIQLSGTASDLTLSSGGCSLVTDK